MLLKQKRGELKNNMSHY